MVNKIGLTTVPIIHDDIILRNYPCKIFLAGRDNSLQAAVINNADKGVKKKQLSQVNQWITHLKSLPVDADIIEHFTKKVKWCINFISCFTLRVKRVPLELKFLIIGGALPPVADRNYPFLYFHLTILETLTTIICLYNV